MTNLHTLYVVGFPLAEGLDITIKIPGMKKNEIDINTTMNDHQPPMCFWRPTNSAIKYAMSAPSPNAANA
jgi:hypothetical protein